MLNGAGNQSIWSPSFIHLLLVSVGLHTIAGGYWCWQQTNQMPAVAVEQNRASIALSLSFAAPAQLASQPSQTQTAPPIPSDSEPVQAETEAKKTETEKIIVPEPVPPFIPAPLVESVPLEDTPATRAIEMPKSPTELESLMEPESPTESELSTELESPVSSPLVMQAEASKSDAMAPVPTPTDRGELASTAVGESAPPPTFVTKPPISLPDVMALLPRVDWQRWQAQLRHLIPNKFPSKPKTPSAVKPVSPSVPSMLAEDSATKSQEVERTPLSSPAKHETAYEAPTVTPETLIKPEVPETPAPASLPSTPAEARQPAQASSGARDRPVQPLASNPAPAYPESAHQANQEGKVLLRVTVGTDGQIQAIALHQSSGVAALDDAALTTVRTHWRFQPATCNGSPVVKTVLLPIHFRLLQKKP